MSTLTVSDMAAAIKAEHLAARAAGETFIEHAIKAGHLLIDAKAKFPHGQWLPWLEANCDISERMSQHYMRLARNIPKLTASKAKSISDLTLTKALEHLGHKSRQPLKAVPPIPAPVERVAGDDIKADTAVSADVDFATVENKPEVVEIDIDADELRAQADALEIQAQAKRRLADEYDAAQERGEVAKQGNIPDQNVSKLADIGVSAKDIHEARQIRDADAAEIEPDPRAFVEPDPKRRKRRESWRLSFMYAFDDALTIEDVEWVMARLTWQLRTGYFNDGAA